MSNTSLTKQLQVLLNPYYSSFAFSVISPTTSDMTTPEGYNKRKVFHLDASDVAFIFCDGL